MVYPSRPLISKPQRLKDGVSSSSSSHVGQPDPPANPDQQLDGGRRPGGGHRGGQQQPGLCAPGTQPVHERLDAPADGDGLSHTDPLDLHGDDDAAAAASGQQQQPARGAIAGAAAAAREDQQPCESDN